MITSEEQWAMGSPRRDPKVTAFHTITLEKVAGRSPSRRDTWRRPRLARVGALYTYTYKYLTRDEGLRRAAAALIRDFPDENRLHWKELR